MAILRIVQAALLFMFLFSVGAFAYRVCEFAVPPENSAAESFRHRRNRLASVFHANHSGNDAIAVLGKNAKLEAKFCYGMIGKDLFDEYIEIWIDDCSGEYQLLHRGRTDSDGRVSFVLPTQSLNATGEYRVLMKVVADGSSVISTLRIVEPGSKAVVFDIDGTLTTIEDHAQLEVISDFVGGNYSPQPRDSAVELSKFLQKDNGYQIIYLSGRHYLLNDMTRVWLSRNDFAPGTLILTQTMYDLISLNSSVGKFKLDKLNQLKDSGLEIIRAYGNARTDVFAYQSAGLATNQIFIVGSYSGAAGSSALGHDFTEHYHSLINGGNASGG